MLKIIKFDNINIIYNKKIAFAIKLIDFIIILKKRLVIVE